MFDDLLYFIRDSLEEMHTSGNDNDLNLFFNTLVVLEEFTTKVEDKTYVEAIDELLYAARHFGYAEHKVYIPTVEELKGKFGANQGG